MPIERRKLQAYTHLELFAKQVVEGFITGMHKSPFHGFSVEFAEHRAYNTGESTRHLDWKLYAKTDKLFVKRYEEETNLRARIIIDTSSSMYFPEGLQEEHKNKLGFSVYATAALIELLKKQRDAFGLSTFNSKVDFHSDVRSNQNHQRFLYTKLEEYLGKEVQLQTTSAVDAIHEISDRIQQRSLVVIFSDFLDNSKRQDELLSALQHLRYNKHEVLLFHVFDGDKELNLNFDNRPYQFVDMESGKTIKLNPIEVKQSYVEKMDRLQKEINLKCGQYGIEYIPSDIQLGFHQVLWPFLVKRKKLY